MVRHIAQLGLVFVLHASTSGWMCAAAQGFNIRHDAFDRHLNGFGFAVEQNSADEFVAFCNEAFLDTVTGIFYPLVLTSERFSTNGDFLSEDSIVVYYKNSSIGWSNASVALPDGRYVVAGSTQDSTSVGGTWIGLFWFEQDGTPINYLELLGDSATEWIGRGVKRTPDSGFIIVGETTVSGVLDAFLLKTDSVGNVEWWQTYGHPTRLDYATSVDLAPDGGYFIGATYPQLPNSGGQYVQWIMHTDEQGNSMWDHFDGDPTNETYSAAVLSTSAGDLVYATGKCVDQASAVFWLQLVKLAPDGEPLWERTYDADPVRTAGFRSVAEVVSSGDLIACGEKWYQTDGGFPYRKGILVRANSDGDSLWMREYFYYDSVLVDCQGVFRDVQPTPDGGFVVVGETRGNINGINPPGLSVDVWVVKVDSLGCIIPGCDDFSTVITVQATNLGSALSVYPNPAHGSTTVKVALPLGSPFVADLHVRLVNGEGKEVLVQKAVIGENAIPLLGLAAGIYHLHLTSGTTWLSGTKLVVE
ncbi:MAG: T9SS type A sorting domain-containing protein [Flavobacteriales bacterium]|nr:T9SS type A sorting domain-containing protein [Flavobacteriales bacterium]MBL0045579.1 T9SS type A sorting domain-containing protein [Flavobacteriales bacterium]